MKAQKIREKVQAHLNTCESKRSDCDMTRKPNIRKFKQKLQSDCFSTFVQFFLFRKKFESWISIIFPKTKFSKKVWRRKRRKRNKLKENKVMEKQEKFNVCLKTNVRRKAKINEMAREEVEEKMIENARKRNLSYFRKSTPVNCLEHRKDEWIGKGGGGKIIYNFTKVFWKTIQIDTENIKLNKLNATRTIQLKFDHKKLLLRFKHFFVLGQCPMNIVPAKKKNPKDPK